MTNRDLWEAFTSLSELNARGLPPFLAVRVALNFNHLRPLYDALDKGRLACSAEAKTTPEDLQGVEPMEAAVRSEAFAKAWNALLMKEAEVEWKSPAPIKGQQLNTVKEVSGLAALLAVGVLTEPDSVKE